MIQMGRYKQINQGLIFILLLLFVSWIYNYHKILFFPPYALHVWRQADCLSFALNYFNENLNFFTPEVNNLGNSGNGKTVSEFPIIYYTVAQLWKVFGQKEFIFRLINITIVFFGLFNLHRLAGSVLKDRFFAIFIPLFLFTSPVLVYYTNNFLADAPAFGLALSGCYYLYRYVSFPKKSTIWFASFCFLLGGLIKITSLIIFFSLSGFLILELLLNYRNTDKGKLKNLIIGFSAIMTITISWYVYARYYNSINNSGFFLQSIYPIWDTTTTERQIIFESLQTKLLSSFFNRIALASIFLLFISLFVFYKKVNRLLLTTCIFCFSGTILYLILWFKAFDVHDYYLTNLLIFIPLILLTFFEFLKRNYSKIFHHILIKFLFSIVLAFLIFQTAMKNRIKYDDKKYFAKDILISQSDREYWEWNHWYYKNNFIAFETIKPYLRSLKITPKDKVICLADGSINISLYLMDQKGYTKYGYASFSDRERVNFAIDQGCKYLILSSEELKKPEELEPFLTNKIGQYQNISIYALTTKLDS